VLFTYILEKVLLLYRYYLFVRVFKVVDVGAGVCEQDVSASKTVRVQTSRCEEIHHKVSTTVKH